MMVVDVSGLVIIAVVVICILAIVKLIDDYMSDH